MEAYRGNKHLSVEDTLAELNKPKEYIPKEEPKKVNVIACNNCHKTNVTLIKATDSYYCKECFYKLGKTKFKEKGR